MTEVATKCAKCGKENVPLIGFGVGVSINEATHQIPQKQLCVDCCVGAIKKVGQGIRELRTHLEVGGDADATEA